MTGDVAALAGGVGRQKVAGAGLVEADELGRAGINEELLAVLLSMYETVEQGAGEAGGVGGGRGNGGGGGGGGGRRRVAEKRIEIGKARDYRRISDH